MKNLMIKNMNFIFIAITTVICVTWLTFDILKSNEVVDIEYELVNDFNAEEIISTFTDDELELFNEYRENGMTVFIDPVLLTLNEQNELGTKLRTNFQNFMLQAYGIYVTIVNSDDDLSQIDLHASSVNDRYEELQYSLLANSYSTITAYSQSEIPRNIFERIVQGEEVEIITTRLTYNYLIDTIGDLENLKLAEISGSESNLANTEGDLYNYLIDPTYSDAIVLAVDNNLFFNYRYEYGKFFESESFYSTPFDVQYTYLGSNNDIADSLKSKLFSSSWVSEYTNFVQKTNYPDIISHMISRSFLNDDNGLNEYLENIETIKLGAFYPYFPYLFDVNGIQEGYHVIMFEHFDNILTNYDFEFEFVSYDEIDYNTQTDFIYTNFYDSLSNTGNYIYSDYYITDYYKVVSKDDRTTYSTLAQIEGKIAIPNYITDYVYLLDSFAEDDIIMCSSPLNCKTLLDDDEVDYMLVADANYNYFNSLGSNYKTNFTSTIAFDGFYAVNADDPNALYLLELINILLPTINHESLYNLSLTSYENYIAEYNFANANDSSTLLIIIIYVITLLIFAVFTVYKYRQQSNKSAQKIKDLVKVSNIGMLSVKVEDVYENNDKSTIPTQVAKYYLNLNLIRKLQITNYSFDITKNMYYVLRDEFTSTIKAYLRSSDNTAYELSTDSSVDSKMKDVAKLKVLTILHKTLKTKEDLYLKYNISKSDNSSEYTFSGLVTDTTFMHTQYKLLEDIAYVDKLTNLYNVSKLQEDLKTNNYNYYITLNITKFKFFNESYGSQIADIILAELATKLKKLLGKENSAYRMVADNFLILSNYKDKKDVEVLLAKITSECSIIRLEEYIDDIKLNLRFTLSDLDYSKYKDYSDFSSEMFVRNSLGKNTKDYYINEEEYEKITFLRNLQTEVFKLETFDDFEVYFQPKINPFTNKCFGAEALIRWNHKVHGRLSPVNFISKFKRLGKIGRLDKFVLSETCKVYNLLSNEQIVDENFKISLNLSEFSLLHLDFSKKISEVLEEYKVNYKNIEIEILETVDLQFNMEIVEKIKELHELGMTVSIDDYGRGYSNVYTATLLPFTKLKFDKTIIDDIDTNPEKCKMFKDLVEMNRSIGHDILAEGVEKESQVEIIKEIGISEVQGYVYSKPLPLSEFKKFLKENKSN